MRSQALVITLVTAGIPTSYLLLQTEHAGGSLGAQW